MSKDNNRTVFRRAADHKWVDKRNSSNRGFAYETQGEAVAASREKLINSGGGELTIKGRDGKIRSKDTLGNGNDPIPPRDREH